jgi:hypothetical protein
MTMTKKFMIKSIEFGIGSILIEMVSSIKKRH